MGVRVLVLAALCAAAVADGAEDAEGQGNVATAPGVRHISDSTELELVVQATDVVFVMFYEPWCGHSKKFIPTWTELARRHHGKPGADDKSQMIVMVDCSLDGHDCGAYDVTGYPHVKLFVDGAPLPKFKGDRKLFVMEEYLASRGVEAADGDDGILKKSETLQAEIDSAEVLFVLFFSPYCMHCDRMMKAWTKMAEERQGEKTTAGRPMRIVRADCMSSDLSCTAHSVNAFPTMHLYLDGVKQPAYKGARDKRSLTAYVMSEGDATNTKYAQEVSGKEAATLIRENMATLLFFPKPDCDSLLCEELEQTIENLAEAMNEKDGFRVARLNCGHAHSQAACEEYAVTEEMLPDLVIFGRATGFVGKRVKNTMSKSQLTVEMAKATFPAGRAVSKSLKEQEARFAKENSAEPKAVPLPPAPPKPIVARTGDDAADLFAAASAGDLVTVLELVDSGAELDLADPADEDRTALHKAAGSAAEGSAQVAEELLSVGADPEAQDGNGETPLMTAARVGSDVMVLLLVDNGADVSAVDNQGWSALHFAVYHNHPDVVKLLVDSGADASVEDSSGVSPAKLAQEQVKLSGDRTVLRHLAPSLVHKEL